MRLVSELRRRNVFRVTIAYLAAAWLLTEVAGTLFPAFGIPDWGVRFIVIVLALGFVPTLIFSWVYELTPEGLKLETEVVREESITYLTAKRLDKITIVLVAAALLFIVADRLWMSQGVLLQPQTPAPIISINPNSIAVLPFLDMSEDQSHQWFADGLAEEIRNTLTRAPNLMVSARTSSVKYRDSNLDAPAIAGALGVAHVLEGSVRRSQARVRVTVQLVRASDGFHIWSEQFDRDLDDVISIQEDLAMKVAEVLHTTMDRTALEEMLSAGTRSVEAYEHYLNGLSRLARYTEMNDLESLEAALDHFETACEVDPSFAAAQYQAASIWRSHSTLDRRHDLFDSGLVDAAQHEALARYRARMAAAIDNAPDEPRRMLYEAELAITQLRPAHAVTLLKRVLQILPDSLDAAAALGVAARLSSDREAQNLALETFLRRGDEVSASAYLNSVRTFVPSKTHEERIMELVARFPDSESIAFQAHRALLWAGDFEKASELYARAAPILGRSRIYADVRQACASGDRLKAEQILKQVEQTGDDELAEWYILTLLGEHEKASQALTPLEDRGEINSLASCLNYEQFDPRPFPSLMLALQREGIDRPPPRTIPFACPKAGDSRAQE